MFSGNEILIIAVIIMILFGATAIPKFARNLGKAKSEFERGLKESDKPKDKEGETSSEKAKTDETKGTEQKPREL